MLKVLITIFITLSLIITFFNSEVYAQVPTGTPDIRFTNEFEAESEPNAIISALKNFINGFDELLGGFIFYTPDPFAEKIALRDKSEIAGIGKYRKMFLDIAIPVIAIVISAIALGKIRSDSAIELKSFIIRLLMVAVMFLTVPLLFSYSIQANNLLVEKIEHTQSLTGVLSSYLDKTQEKIDEGAPSEQYGIPGFNISLQGGLLKSLGSFIVQVFLFILTFIFLLFGLLYIGFQFIIRFAMILFLSVIYPIVIPFVLTEKTQSIVNSYFKSFFSALIAQPAFVLGYAITADIFRSLLEAKGPSIGMIFFYTGFLFFLGIVTILVAKIFGEAWNVSLVNARAAFAVNSVKKSAVYAGNIIKNSSFAKSILSSAGQAILNKATGGPSGEGPNTNSNGQFNNSFSYKKNGNGDYLPNFSRKLSKQGLKVSVEDRKQGIVKLSGDAYSYHDPKSKVTSIYPTKSDAVTDGISPGNLQKTTLNKASFIDTSTFSEKYPNPHNRAVYSDQLKKNFPSTTAHLTQAASSDRVKNFLEASRKRNKAFGVKGVIVKRYGDMGNKEHIRIYTDQEI